MPQERGFGPIERKRHTAIIQAPSQIYAQVKKSHGLSSNIVRVLGSVPHGPDPLLRRLNKTFPVYHRQVLCWPEFNTLMLAPVLNHGGAGKIVHE